MTTATRHYVDGTILLLTDDERLVLSKAIRARNDFTDRPASLAVRMAFWEIEAARVWPEEFGR